MCFVSFVVLCPPRELPARRTPLPAARPRSRRRARCSTAIASVATTSGCRRRHWRSTRSTRPMSPLTQKCGRRSSASCGPASMPPIGARKPDETTYRRLVEELETSLDRGAATHPSPGAPVVHRLNRAEYANAIRDLLALDVDTASLLPADDSAYGFDNVSDVLNVSPSLQERYLTAARKISALAVGDVRITPSESTYRVRQDRSQNQHIEGLPLGTIGGTLVRHTFPLDGEYLFQSTFFRTNLGMMRGLEYPHRIEYTIDGERVHLATIGGKSRPRSGVRETDRDRRCDGSPSPRSPSGEGRSSRGRGLFRRGPAGRRHGPAAAVLAQLVRHARLDRPAPYRDVLDVWTVQSERSRGHAEPPEDFRVPARLATGRDAVCPAHHGVAGPPRLSPDADAHRPRAIC